MSSFVFPFEIIKKFKLYISAYNLKFKNKSLFSSPLEGALLAFDFGSGLTGYSDFLPWPAFGENTLSHQLKQIQRGRLSKRFLIAKHNAFLDAKARTQKRSLFFSLQIPSSHFLIEDLLSFKKPEWILERGFKTIKVKLKPYKINEQREKLKQLSGDLKEAQWRLDLNGMSWLVWKNKLDFLKNSVDFIEDPLPEKSSFGKQEQSLFAQDWINSPHFQIKIVKPSRDRLDFLIKELALFRWKRIIFTHSFDHPLGQAISAFWAGAFYKRYNRFFETGAFINTSLEEIASYPINSKTGAHFSPPGGFGFGFSDALTKENWRRWI